MKYYRIVAIAAILLCPSITGATVIRDSFDFGEYSLFSTSGGRTPTISFTIPEGTYRLQNIEVVGSRTGSATASFKLYNSEGTQIGSTISGISFAINPAFSTTTLNWFAENITLEGPGPYFLKMLSAGSVHWASKVLSGNWAYGCSDWEGGGGETPVPFDTPEDCVGYPTTETIPMFRVNAFEASDAKQLYFQNPWGTGLSTTTAPLRLEFGVVTDENVNVQVTVQQWNVPGSRSTDTFSYAAGVSTTPLILLSPTATTTYLITLAMRYPGNFSNILRTVSTRWHYKPQGGLTPYERAFGEERGDGSGLTTDQSDDGEGAGLGECTITDLTGCFKIALSWAFKPSDENILELKSRAADAAFIWPFGYVTNFVTYFTEMETSTTTKPGNIVIPFSDIEGSGMDDVTILDWDAIEATSTRIQEAEEAFAVPINMLMSVLFVFMVVSTVRGMAGEKDTA